MSLDWSNERYVRFYTRKTPTMQAAGWELRAMLREVMLVLDRNGEVDLGSEGADGLAALVQMPVDLVERGLQHWTNPKRSTLVLEGNVLRMPNFREAQEAKASDAKRASDYRERHAEAERVTKRDVGVTLRDESSRDVTDRHAASRSVTPSLTVPSLAVPNQEKDPAPAASGVQCRSIPASDTPPPDDVPITDDMLGRCMMRGYPAPTKQDVADCLTNARKKGFFRADWVEEVVDWMRKAKGFRASDRKSVV